MKSSLYKPTSASRCVDCKVSKSASKWILKEVYSRFKWRNETLNENRMIMKICFKYYSVKWWVKLDMNTKILPASVPSNIFQYRIEIFAKWLSESYTETQQDEFCENFFAWYPFFVHIFYRLAWMKINASAKIYMKHIFDNILDDISRR